ncbi:MAG: hypothetical protein U1E62_06710 [Alsobacter sp.]
MAFIGRVLRILLLILAVAMTPERAGLVGMQTVEASHHAAMAEHQHHDGMTAKQERRSAADIACAKWCAIQCGTMSDMACWPSIVSPDSYDFAPVRFVDEREIGLNPDPAVPPPRTLI